MKTYTTDNGIKVIGDRRSTYNDLFAGREVTARDEKGNRYALALEDGLILATPEQPAGQPPQPPDESPYDFDSGGFGIGGLGRYEEPPVIPSAKALERYERLEKRATYCRQCGQSDVFDGAMFTTLAGSGLCDDCVGG
jgi:hypothetical protein